MDGGGLRPGARWAAQSSESWAPPPALRGCRDTVGNGLPLWQHGALGLTVKGLRVSPSQDRVRASTACRHYVIHAGTILESRHEAEVCGSGWHGLVNLGS